MDAHDRLGRWRDGDANIPIEHPSRENPSLGFQPQLPHSEHLSSVLPRLTIDSITSLSHSSIYPKAKDI